MKPISYPIKHRYQPTSTSCSQTALSILFGHYGKELTVQQILDQIPNVFDENGEPVGSINQQLAAWCLTQGFEVTFYTFDCQVIDQSWSKLPKDELLERLEARKDGWEVPAMGSLFTRAYTQSYIDLIEAGGELHIQPAVTSKLLYQLLEDGPVLPCVSFSTLYGGGRTRIDSETAAALDDVNGRALTHSIVIYGVDDKGRFLVADPEKKPGLVVVDPEVMIAAISTAQLECDNLLFQLKLAK